MPACVTTCATARAEPEVNGSSSPSAPQLLFVKLPACVALIDPGSQAVAEIVMAPASTTGSAPAPI
jgi:hypothetical protein